MNFIIEAVVTDRFHCITYFSQHLIMCQVWVAQLYPGRQIDTDGMDDGFIADI